MGIRRFDVFLVNLDPTVGAEIQKSRPCLIISPNSINNNLRTIIIAPMTTRVRAYPTRVLCEFQGKEGQIALDQIRTVDKSRLIRILGKLDADTQHVVFNVLADLFAP